MQSADFLTIFAELFVYFKKNYYLCSQFGCKGASARIYMHTRNDKNNEI